MIKTHFRPLDGLRGIAILLVIFFHAYHYHGPLTPGRWLDTMAQAGWMGVTAFYVLSGFLITGILLDTRRRPHYLRDFYARRSLRIFPLYFAFLCAYFFVAPWIPYTAAALPLPDSGTWYTYWTYTTNMREFLTGRYHDNPTLQPLWSLAVEEQVYLFWPFLILLIPPRYLTASLVGLAVISFSWRFGTRWTRQSVELSHGWMLAALEPFAAGGLVARLVRANPVLPRRLAPWVTIAAATLILGMAAWLGHFSDWLSPVEMLTVGLSLASTFFAGLIGWSVSTAEDAPINRVLISAWLRSIGKYSYAMYLFHMPILALLVPVVYSGRTGLVRHQVPVIEVCFTLIVAATSYGAAWLSWHLGEERFLRLKRYFPLSGGVPRPKATASTSAAAPNR